MKNFYIALMVVIGAALSGCADTGYQSNVNSANTNMGNPGNTYSSAVNYGVIDSIQTVQADSNSPTGVGAVVGGVVGGLLGNQIGGGSGRTVATAAGVVGGALAGNQVEKHNRGQTRTVYQVGVRLDNGGYQTIVQDSVANLYVGNRVRVENGVVYRSR